MEMSPTGKPWEGDNPFFLAIHLASGDDVLIDLDERGWMATYADYMRVRSRWALLHKARHAAPVLLLIVEEGEQPYYTGRHFRNTSAPGEVVAYGLGKKRLDGHTDRIWVFPDAGVICTGDDVDQLGRELVGQYQMGIRRG